MFHLYGLIIGVALISTLLLIEKKLSLRWTQKFQAELWWQAAGWILVGAFLGARGYHVITDFNLYHSNIWGIFQVWNGGLSIIGAVLGAAIAASMWCWWRYCNKKTFIPLGILADAAAFALPVGQAIGRLGNFVNQELYGLPTNLPWKIFIDPQHRVTGYSQFAFFHPLFAYEAVAMIFFAAGLWYSDRTQKNPPFGSGHYFAIYVAYYAVVRFGLDFLRIDKSFVGSSPIAKNQLVMVFLFMAAILFLARHKSKI